MYIVNVLVIKDFILAKKYTYTDVKINPVDTALLMNAGAAAINSKKELEYWVKLALEFNKIAKASKKKK